MAMVSVGTVVAAAMCGESILRRLSRGGLGGIGSSSVVDCISTVGSCFNWLTICSTMVLAE